MERKIKRVTLALLAIFAMFIVIVALNTGEADLSGLRAPTESATELLDKTLWRTFFTLCFVAIVLLAFLSFILKPLGITFKEFFVVKKPISTKRSNEQGE